MVFGSCWLFPCFPKSNKSRLFKLPLIDHLGLLGMSLSTSWNLICFAWVRPPVGVSFGCTASWKMHRPRLRAWPLVVTIQLSGCLRKLIKKLWKVSRSRTPLQTNKVHHDCQYHDIYLIIFVYMFNSIQMRLVQMGLIWWLNIPNHLRPFHILPTSLCR